MSTYGFTDENTIVASVTQNGIWQLIKVDLDSNKVNYLDQDSSYLEGIFAAENRTAYIGASSSKASNVFLFEATSNHHFPIINQDSSIRDSDISSGRPVTFTTTNNQKSHAFYYPPQNSHYTSDDLPPLIVICHGGPTGATSNSLNLKVQYWTNRGFAVMDVNYRGSTGYGRKYRHLLHKNWGIYDVEDVCAAAEYATKSRLCNPNQIIIKGSSAGGYTTLAAITFKSTFNCGVSLYGIGDLETLARDTHKFEAKYLDSLIGPYPEQRQYYIDRSPIHFVNQISCPLLIFQGLEDKVVPPNQAEDMFNAVKNKSLAVACVAFANEGHGFRHSENIQHMLNVELEFYLRVLALSKLENTQLKIHNI